MEISKQNLNKHIFLIRNRFKRIRRGLNINCCNINESFSVPKIFKINKRMYKQ